jgi:hypothetical protein
MAQHLGVAPGTLVGCLRLGARPRADESCDDSLGDSSVHRQPVD